MASIHSLFSFLLVVLLGTVSVGNGQSPTSSTDPCPDELQAVELCFATDTTTSQTSCEDCISSSWPATIVSCQDIDNETCSGLETCDCGSCGFLVKGYIECLSGCTLPCSSPTPSPVAVPTSQPTSSPAASPEQSPTAGPCSELHQAFNDCVDPVNGGGTCETCIVSHWPGKPDSCSDIDDETCEGLATCDCKGCDNEFIAYLTCLTHNACEWNCQNSFRSATLAPTLAPTTAPTTAPTLAPTTATPITLPPSSAPAPFLTAPTTLEPTAMACEDEMAVFSHCLDASALDMKNCTDCMAKAYTENDSSCSYIEEATCLGEATCPCGHCGPAIDELINCRFQCNFSCPLDYRAMMPTTSPAPSTTLNPAATISPGPSATKCTDEMTALYECEGSTLPCYTCVQDSFSADASCAEVENSVCQSLQNCSSCVTCGDQALAMLDCIISQCDISCGGDTMPTVSPVPTPAPPTDSSPTPSCLEEQADLDLCLNASGLDPGTCGACFFGYWPDNKNKTCADIDDVSCTAIQKCPCGDCGSQITTLVNCLEDCDLTCEGTTYPPTASPAPSSSVAPSQSPQPSSSSRPTISPVAPTTQPPIDTKCPVERASFDTCVAAAAAAAAGSVQNGSQCEVCVVAYWPQDNFSSCSQLVNATCVGLDECPCGDCAEQFLSLVNCMGNCDISCGPLGDSIVKNSGSTAIMSRSFLFSSSLIACAGLGLVRMVLF